MSSSNKPKNYELVLEGLENDNPQTLQKVKGILIGNLELSISEVQKILESYPLTIKRSESETELAVHLNQLKSAGAKVLLIKPQSESSSEEDEVQEEESASNEIEFKVENPVSLEEITSKAQEEETSQEENNAHDEQEIEFEFEFDPLPSQNAKKAEKPANAYELNLNEDTELSLKELEKEFGESLQITEQKKEDIENIENLVDGNEFALDLKPAESGLELLDSPTLANVEEDTGEWESDKLSESLISQAPAQVAESAAGEPTPTPSMASIEQSLIGLETENREEADKVAQDAAAEKADPLTLAPLAFELEGVEHPEPVPVVAAPAATAAVSTTPVLEKKEEVKIISEPAQEKVLTKADVPVVTATPLLKSSKKKVPADLLLPIAIGGMLLGVVNWFYYSSKPEDKSAVPQIEIPDVPDTQRNVKAVVVPEAPAFPYAGEFNGSDMQIKLSFSASIDKVNSFNLELSTPKPIDLTPEEIVQGRAPNLWLRKAEAQNIVFKKNEDGSLASAASMKVYFEQGDLRERVIADLNVILKIESENSAAAEVKIELNTKAPEDFIEGIKVLPNTLGKHSVMAKKFIRLEKQAPQAVPAEAPAAVPADTQ